MSISYRTQAERRASVTRPYVLGARASGARTPLELPPWGYGAGRPVTLINSTQRLFRPKMRSTPSHAKQTTSCCETGPVQRTAACSRPASLEHTGLSNWSNSTTYDRDGAADLSVVVELKSTESSTEKSRPKPNEMSWNAASSGGIMANVAVPAQHSYNQEVVHSIGDTAVIGGGPVVTSSSMETWTTYEDGTSSSPLVQSTTSSPHYLASPKLDSSTVNTPCSPPLLHPPVAKSWSGRLSPKSQTSLADLTNHRKTDATKASTGSSSSSSPRVIASTTKPTANEPAAVVTQDVVKSAPSSADRSPGLKKVPSSASGEVVVNPPVSPTSSSNGKGPAPRRVSSRTDPCKSPSSTSKASDQDKSSLMVGLVKVKSRDTGLMIDCPILETSYPNETVESSSPAARQSSSHKVVLIKAVVPRWAWNGRAHDSSSQASPSSARTNDSVISKRKSLVSVNTQTSDTLLPARRTISAHQTMSSPSPPVTSMHVPALQDDSQLTPSPKPPACFAKGKSSPKTPAECNVRSPKSSSRVPCSPNNNSNLFSSLLVMSEKSKESESVERASTSIECDSLMVNRLENLKLDLQFSSSGNNSDNESVTHEKIKRTKAECSDGSSSSSSEDLASMCGQRLSTRNWSCAATAATASSEAVVSLKPSAGYIDNIAGRTTPSPSSSQQKQSSAGRNVRTPPSQRRSAASTSHADNSARSRVSNSSKCQSSTKNSQRSDTKARLTPDSCSQSNLSTCKGRSSTSNVEVEQNVWPERDYASRSESSLSAGSKSTSVHDYRCEMPPTNKIASATTSPKATSPRATTSPRNPRCTEQSSTLAPAQSQLETFSGESNTCVTEPLGDNMRRHHHRRGEFRSNAAAAAGVKSTSHHQSKHHEHRRSTPAKKHRAAVEPKSPPTQGRYKVTASDGSKRSGGDSQRKCSGPEAKRRSEAAQSSRSTGSMAVQRNGTTAAKRQHSSSAAGRHASHKAGGGTNKWSSARDVQRGTADRRTSMSREQYSSVMHGDIRRRGHGYADRHSTCEPRCDKKISKPTTSTSLDRRQHRHDARSINASPSRSNGSVSRDHRRPQSAHANYFLPPINQPTSTQPKHSTDTRPSLRNSRDDARESKFTERRQSLVGYCSPRSHKPFPPPISDRYPSPLQPAFGSSTAAAAAVVATALTAEPVRAQYVIVQRQKDNDYADFQPADREDCGPAARRTHERLCRSAQTSTDQHRRANAAAKVTDEVVNRRRKKLPATPPTWSSELPPVRATEKPAWKQYFA